MSHVIRAAATDQIALFRAYDDDGTAKVDLTSSTTGLALSVFRVGASAVSISSLSNKAADDTTHADGAIRQVQGNLYSVDLPDAACATQVASIVVKGAYTGGVIEGVPHPIVAYSPTDAAGLGLSRVDAAITTRSSHSATDVWAAAARSLTDKAGFSLAAAGLDPVTLPANFIAEGNIAAGAFTSGKFATDAISAAALSAAAVAKIEAALLNEGDGQALIDAIVAAIDAADIDTDILPALIRDAILNRVLAGNHDTAGTVGKVLQDTKAKTDNLPASPAAVGSEMALVNDAITAAKFDEATAFPLASADTGATQVARTGNDGDTLETLSDEIALVGGGGGGDATESKQDTILSKMLAYFQLAVRKDAAIATDNATELTAINADGGSGVGVYNNVTDSQEAIRDRGDAAWAGVGGSVIVSPLSAGATQRVVGTQILYYVNEVKELTVGVSDEAGDPVTLSGSYDFTIMTPSTRQVIFRATTLASTLTVNSNEFTFTNSASVTARHRMLAWELVASDGSGEVVARGPVVVN